MTTEKITIRTAGLPLSGRKRKLDSDHVVQILDLTRRGYHLSVMSDETPWWYVSIMRHEGRAFVNQPEHTTDVLFVHTTYANDDARLTDKPYPQWVTTLFRLLEQLSPPTLYIRTGIKGATDEPDPQDAEAV